MQSGVEVFNRQRTLPEGSIGTQGAGQVVTCDGGPDRPPVGYVRRS